MNKTSLDGDRRLPTSEYRRRRGSAIGIGVVKRLVKSSKPWPIEAAFSTALIGGFPVTRTAWRTSSSRASDWYQARPKRWPKMRDPTGSQSRVGLDQFFFLSLPMSFSLFLFFSLYIKD
ncbi:hypothetical protein AB3S75_021881 [Citrus x aurantiifolia]